MPPKVQVLNSQIKNEFLRQKDRFLTALWEGLARLDTDGAIPCGETLRLRTEMNGGGYSSFCFCKKMRKETKKGRV